MRLTPMAEFEEAMAAAGLVVRDRYAGWDGAPFDAAGGYVVAVHTPA